MNDMHTPYASGTGGTYVPPAEDLSVFLKEKPSDGLRHFLGDTRLLMDKCIKILSIKNHDYADGGDMFSNFKFAGEAAGVTSAQSILVLMGVKIARLTQLVGNGKVPMNEKIEDTIMDLINYTLLLNGLINQNASVYEKRET